MMYIHTYIYVSIYILYIVERIPGGQSLRMPASYATYAMHSKRMLYSRGYPGDSVYVCLPHTLRMRASYATYACMPASYATYAIHSKRMLYSRGYPGDSVTPL